MKHRKQTKENDKEEKESTAAAEEQAEKKRPLFSHISVHILVHDNLLEVSVGDDARGHALA